jgi:alpha-tubulin suppressor-like RCC1 family protein
MGDGTVRCWGDGTGGEVDGGDAERHVPVQVPGIAHAVDIAVGPALSCARLAGGEVWCWGSRTFLAEDDEDAADSDEALERAMDRELADRQVDHRAPEPVPALAYATKLWLGHGGDGCAGWANGAIKCWGSGAAYLAVGHPGQYGSPPAPVVPALRGATDVAIGETLGCAVMKNATVRCWGRNEHGQVGDDTTWRRLAPTPVRGLRGARPELVRVQW